MYWIREQRFVKLKFTISDVEFSGKTYQFQIIGNNELGEGHPSEIVNVTTKGNLIQCVSREH